MADKVTKICMDIHVCRKLEKNSVLNIMEGLQIPNILEICYLYNLLWKYVKLDVSSTPRMPPHAAKVLRPCLIFSNFKGDNCQKSLHQQFQPIRIKVREWKLKISHFLVISRGITLSKSMIHNQIRT
jgi:hypothetical protein